MLLLKQNRYYDFIAGWIALHVISVTLETVETAETVLG
jgi:hypothetical protein